jgi:hypothetical protein
MMFVSGGLDNDYADDYDYERGPGELTTKRTAQERRNDRDVHYRRRYEFQVERRELKQTEALKAGCDYETVKGWYGM